MSATTLYALNTADWTLDHSLLVQAMNFGESYNVRCPFYLIEHTDGLVLYDTGLSHEMATDPEEYGPFGAPEIADFVPAIDLDAGQPPRDHLDDLGYTPEDVDYVVLSHLHTDHAGNVTTFRDAEILVQQEELRYAFAPDPVQRTFYLGGDFAQLRTGGFDVTPTTGRVDLFGDSSVELIPTPGHTPGHQSLKVTLPETGTVILASDIANLRAGYENDLAASFVWSLDEAVRSIRKIKQIAREDNADVFIHHDRDDQARIPADGLT